MTLRDADKEFVIGVLVDQAVDSPVGGPHYFRNLILQIDLPKPVVANRVGALTGSPEFDARNLTTWSLNYGINPNTRIHVLGSFILAMMKQAGFDQQLRLAAIVVTSRLLPQDQLVHLRSQFQIPFSFSEMNVAALDQRGPGFTWHGGEDDLQLQGLFTSEPQVLEVALVMQAATRALSVCRVEVGKEQKGTGVLIGRDLVLTNYHVMGGDLGAERAVLEENARATVLRFGAFSNSGTSAEEGQTAMLHLDKSIVDADPQLDFALLRTSNDITEAKDVRPFSDLGPAPVRSDALYILQHPAGGPMKLALTGNGVTWVNAPAGFIQYLTSTDFGSSGSPCFDANWKLVALHHAGNKKKGEGILMRSIFGRIQQHLNP